MVFMGNNKASADWLNAKFLEWAQGQGQRKTLREFAEWLGVKEGVLGHWMAGRNKPTGDNIDTLAAKLGPEIYDMLGLARPDPLLTQFSKMLDSLPPDEREAFMEQVKKYYDKLAGKRKQPALAE